VFGATETSSYPKFKTADKHIIDAHGTSDIATRITRKIIGSAALIDTYTGSEVVTVEGIGGIKYVYDSAYFTDLATRVTKKMTGSGKLTDSYGASESIFRGKQFTGSGKLTDVHGASDSTKRTQRKFPMLDSQSVIDLTTRNRKMTGSGQLTDTFGDTLESLKKTRKMIGSSKLSDVLGGIDASILNKTAYLTSSLSTVDAIKFPSKGLHLTATFSFTDHAYRNLTVQITDLWQEVEDLKITIHVLSHVLRTMPIVAKGGARRIQAEVENESIESEIP